MLFFSLVLLLLYFMSLWLHHLLVNWPTLQVFVLAFLKKNKLYTVKHIKRFYKFNVPIASCHWYWLVLPEHAFFLPGELSSHMKGQVLVRTNLWTTLCHRETRSPPSIMCTIRWKNIPKKKKKNAASQKAQQIRQSRSSPSPPQWIWIPILI